MALNKWIAERWQAKNDVPLRSPEGAKKLIFTMKNDKRQRNLQRKFYLKSICYWAHNFLQTRWIFVMFSECRREQVSCCFHKKVKRRKLLVKVDYARKGREKSLKSRRKFRGTRSSIVLTALVIFGYEMFYWFVEFLYR